MGTRTKRTTRTFGSPSPTTTSTTTTTMPSCLRHTMCAIMPSCLLPTEETLNCTHCYDLMRRFGWKRGFNLNDWKEEKQIEDCSTKVTGSYHRLYYCILVNYFYITIYKCLMHIINEIITEKI